MTFKSGDTILVDNFATFRLEGDMEHYGYVAFAHARKLSRITREWGKVKDYQFQSRMELLSGEKLAALEAEIAAHKQRDAVAA